MSTNYLIQRHLHIITLQIHSLSFSSYSCMNNWTEFSRLNQRPYLLIHLHGHLVLEGVRARTQSGSSDGQTLQQDGVQRNVHLFMMRGDFESQQVVNNAIAILHHFSFFTHHHPYTRSLQEANNHHTTILSQQLDILLGIITANVIQNYIHSPISQQPLFICHPTSCSSLP